MQVIVIRHKRTQNVVAVVECIEGMKPIPTAKVWARANGFEDIPKDLEVTREAYTVKPFGELVLGIIPCHETDAIRKGELPQ